VFFQAGVEPATKKRDRGFLRFQHSNVDERSVLGTLDTPNKHTMMKKFFLRSLLVASLLAMPFFALSASAAVGDIYETNEGNLLRISPAGGTPATVATGFSNPKGLVFDGNGHLYVADAGKGIVVNFNGGKIYKFAPDGTKTTFVSGLNFPAGLAFDSAGNLFEADSGSGTIFKFAPDGTKISFVTGIGRPYGIAFDATGNLIVADNANGATIQYSPSAVKKVIF